MYSVIRTTNHHRPHSREHRHKYVCGRESTATDHKTDRIKQSKRQKRHTQLSLAHVLAHHSVFVINKVGIPLSKVFVYVLAMFLLYG